MNKINSKVISKFHFTFLLKKKKAYMNIAFKLTYCHKELFIIEEEKKPLMMLT